MPHSEQVELNINTIRFLAVDAIEKAKSGHPGTPMGASVLAYVLWDKYLRHNPKDPHWANRDRFILSAGHASMLLYALLFLTGYDLSLEDIKLFRQMGSKTPGHPEYGLTPGVESTTGPLGQGFANGVGMAIAECRLAQRYNRPGYKIIDHFTYALVSDGDLQEGIASEAASLAGTLKLSKLIYLYDSNDVQQDGKTGLSFKENVVQRFKAYGWNVIGPINGMNVDEVENSILAAQKQPTGPNLIICKTIIGYGSPHKEGTNLSHGEPLGVEEAHLTKEKLGWGFEDAFSVPEETLEYFRKAIDRGKIYQEQWQGIFNNYNVVYPEEAKEFKSALCGELPDGWDNNLAVLFKNQQAEISTRDISGQILNILSGSIPFLFGGSADLAGSTRTILKGGGDFSENDYSGRNLHFGLREHAMGAICNGLALHGGILPFASSFLIFSDYMRPSIRLAAMMKLNLIYIFSHDSIGVGEDGPTHQPIEQIMNLRMVPDLTVIRPADAAETVEAWKLALTRKKGPVALLLTRQNIPVLDPVSAGAAEYIKKGGYVLWESAIYPQIILIGTGSEVHLALEAGKVLQSKGISSRVVSMPSWNIFDEQSPEYKAKVLPPQVTARISVEAGTPIGWERYTGLTGKNIGISHFGISAPGGLVYKYFNLTIQEIVETALKLL
jgi:transketolase